MRRAILPLAVLVLMAGPKSIPAFQEKGSIEGRVVNALSGDALRRVNLTLSKINSKGEPATMQSDSEGRFAFPNLDPGAYRLAGERPGFKRQAYGARLNPSVGALLVVAEGQALKDVTFKLAPDAVISGRVLDQDGEPMPNLLVSALRNGYVRGKRQWSNAGTAQSNDRGEFRIAGLLPGRYVALARNMDVGIGLAGVSKEAPSDKPDLSYASTYYGNTRELSRATPVDLKMGDDRRNTNIQMVKTATVRVRGKVIGVAEGSTLLMLLLRRGSNVAEGPGSMGIAQSSDGSFEIKNVTPGSYILTARNAADPLKSAGALPVEVAEKHVEGLEFRLTPGGELRGRVLAGPEKTAAGKAITVALETVEFQLGEPQSAAAGENGTFVLKDIYPARYRVRVRNAPENFYTKTVKLGGQEADEDGIEVGGGAAELEITLSRGSQVEGLVSAADGRPVPGATVALIPDSRRESQYASTTTDDRGAFVLKGVAPGKYKALVWEDIEADAFRDPEFVKPFEGRAVALALDENGHAKLNLTVIPFNEAAARAGAR